MTATRFLGLLGILALCIGQSASAKDQTCFWKEEGLAPWNFRGVYGLVIEQQLDGSYVAFHSSWTRPSDGSEPDPRAVIKTSYKPVLCQFATDSILLHCSSTRIWKNYDITMISETSLGSNGNPATQSAIEAVVTTFPENEGDMIEIDRHRVQCVNTAMFESIVEQQLRIR